MINYLFSNVNKEKGFSKNQKDYLLKNIDSTMTITFIPTIPDNYNKTDEKVNRYITYFKKIGITFNKTTFIDKRITKEKAKSYIENSDIVFLLGGDPNSQMNFITEYELTDLIKKSKIVIGVSAGSMNQGKRVIYQDEFENNIIRDYQGLSLTSTNIYPHYDKNNQVIMSEIKEIIKIHKLLALPNESFIYIKNKKQTIVGPYEILKKD